MCVSASAPPYNSVDLPKTPSQEVTGLPQPGFSGLQDPIPLSLRKSIAVYEAGKALIAYITPEYDEIARVSICPYNMVTGAEEVLVLKNVHVINCCAGVRRAAGNTAESL